MKAFLRRAITGALFLCLATAMLPAQEPIRIGAWNLEQLGWRKEPQRTDADLDAMAAFVRELGVAVLAVSEVGGEDALRDLARRIGPDWQAVLGTTGSFTERGATTQIGVGFLWNNGKIELLQAEEPLDLPREQDGLPVFHRVPVSACFRQRGGGVDFRAVAVHFKAGRNEADEKKREAEVGLLQGWLKERLKNPREDRDVVILGDFNHTYNSRAHQRLAQGDFVDYLRPRELTPTIVHFDEPIDQIAIGKGFREVRRETFTVHNQKGLADKDAWRKTYSDHFPVSVQLGGGPDDDADAVFTAVPAPHLLPASLRPQPAAPADAAEPDKAEGGKKTGEGKGDDGLLPPGSAVRVLVGGALHDGELLAPLGAWVWLRDEQDKVQAFPSTAVTWVRER